MKQIKIWTGIILCFIVAGMCTVTSVAQQNDSPYRVGYSFMDGQWVENQIHIVENEQVKAETKLFVSDNAVPGEKNDMEKTFVEEMNAEKSSVNQCGDTLYWNLDANGVMTISGTGDMWDFRDDPFYKDTYHECPWESRRSEIKSVKFEAGITYIGADAFANCTNLKNVTFSDTITVIGSFAFLRCANLKNFVLPAELRTLGQQCFDGCEKITKVTIPDTVNFLDSQIFHEASSLTDLYIGGSLDVSGYVCAETCIGSCISLEEIKVSPNNIALTAVDGVLYSKNEDTLLQYPLGKKDKKIVLPNALKRVGQFVADGALYLEEIVFPEGLEEVGVYAFRSMPKLKYLSYPSTMKEISEDNGTYCAEIVYIENKSEAIVPLLAGNSSVWVDKNDTILTEMRKGIVYKKGVVTSVYLEKERFFMSIGESKLLPLKEIEYLNDKVIPNREDLIFVSSSPTVAEISKDGTITAKASGTTTITLKNRYTHPDFNENFSTTCEIVVKKSIADAEIANIKSQTYTGKAIKPAVKVVYGKKTLKKGTDYTVSYENNKKIGEATVVIKGKGSYHGTVKKTFTIKAKKGSVHTVDKVKYKVVKNSINGKGTVSVIGVTNEAKRTSITIGDTVKIGGAKFKVVSIGAKAFSKCKKLKKIVLGKNISSIGKDAFKGIQKKAKFHVPKAKKNSYKKLIKKSGNYKKSMKIVTY